MISHTNSVYRTGKAEILPMAYDVSKGARLFYGERETEFFCSVAAVLAQREETSCMQPELCSKRKDEVYDLKRSITWCTHHSSIL